MLSKIRYYVSKETLHMVYYGIFSSLLIYGSQVWGQQNAVTKKLQILQNKALRIMHFQPPRTSATPLFKLSNILKINDYVNLQNFLLTYRSLKRQLPSSLQGNMNFLEHPHNTRIMGCLQLTRATSKTINYGSRSITSRSIEIWNSINKTHHEQMGGLHQFCSVSVRNAVRVYLPNLLGFRVGDFQPLLSDHCPITAP